MVNKIVIEKRRWSMNAITPRDIRQREVSVEVATEKFCRVRKLRLYSDV